MRSAFTLLLFLGLCSNLQAQTAVTLDPIEITTNPNSDNPNSAYDPTLTVLASDDLRLRGRVTVEEALRYVPGLDVARAGGAGQQTSVFIRGARSEDTLVLVDGIEVNDPSGPSRGFDFANLTVSNIERIEVFRGPQGVRFGPGAMGGVINIITKRGAAQQETQLGIRYGSFDTKAGDARTSGMLGKFDYSFGASGLKSQGFSVASEEEGATEKDAVEITSLSSRLGYRNETGLDIDGTVRLTHNDSDLDRGGGVLNDDPNYTSKFRQLTAGLTARLPLAGGRIRAGYYFTDVEREGLNLADALNTDISRDHFNGQIEKLDLSYDRKLSDNDSVLVSVQNKIESADSTGNYSGFNVDFPNQEQSLRTAAATYAYDDEAFFGDVGLRLDDNSRLDARVNYRLAAGLRFFDAATTLQAAFGTALKAPSLYQLYSAYGDPSLQAERVSSGTLSLQQKISSKAMLDLTYFVNRYKSLIDFETSLSRYQNFGDAKATGFEAEMNYDLGSGFLVSGTYRYLDARDEDTDLRLVRRSQNTFTLAAEYELAKWRVRGDYRWRGSFIDIDPTTFQRKDMPSFGVVDLHTSYQINAWLEGFVRVENVFDRIYQELAGYGTARRSGYVGLTGSF